MSGVKKEMQSELKKNVIQAMDLKVRMKEVSIYGPNGKIPGDAKMGTHTTEQTFYLVMNEEKLDLDVECPNGSMAHVRISAWKDVAAMLSKLRKSGALGEDEEIYDITYSGRVLREDTHLYSAVYGRPKGNVVLM